MNFIIDNFDKLFNSEESLKRLEEIILDLAVKGKLVQQDPNDEPASVLLEKIKAEKEQLIKDKKIKKDKDLAPITEEEIPFEIPKTWQWIKLGEVCNAVGGNGFPIKYQGKTTGIHPFYKVSDLSNCTNDVFVEKSNNWIDDKELINKFTLIPSGSVVFPKIGGALLTNNRKRLKVDGFIDNNCMALRSYTYELSEYLFLFMNTIDLGVFCKGTSVPSVSQSTIENFYFPLPPLAEQKRIVEKVDKLKELINQFREKIQKRDKVRQGLKASIMNEIEKSNSNHDLLENLELIFRNFDSVVKTKEDIKDIRDLVLSLAVKGKLVPQDQNDEPARILLEKIKAEKEQLIKDKKTKKDKDLAPISEEEIPFEIPENWEWVRLGQISEFLNGFAFKSSSYVLDSKNQIIRLGNVKNDNLLLESNPVYVPDEIAEISIKYKLEVNDILVTLTGTRDRRDYFYTLLIDEQMIGDRNLFLNQRVGCIKVNNSLNPKLINSYLKTAYVLNQIFLTETGTANQGNIGSTATQELILPLPPLAEQKRIVLQVEKLMKVCDELEKLVEKSQKEESLLMGSIMNGLVG